MEVIKLAIWQFQFFIVKETKKRLRDVSEEIILSWNETKLDSESVLKLSKTLKKEKSWSEDALQFGKADETCLEIFFEKGNIVEINCRIDVRKITSKTLNAISDFINKNGGMIFLNDSFYKANPENLLSLIKQTVAFKFTKSPNEFLKDLE